MCMFGMGGQGNGNEAGRNRAVIGGLRAFNAAAYGGTNARLTQFTDRARKSLGVQPKPDSMRGGNVTIGSAPGAVKTGG